MLVMYENVGESSEMVLEDYYNNNPSIETDGKYKKCKKGK